MTTPEKSEAVQAVVDRVTSYQESAPDGTIERELRDGLAEAGVELEGGEMTRLIDAVEAARGPVSAADVLS